MVTALITEAVNTITLILSGISEGITTFFVDLLYDGTALTDFGAVVALSLGLMFVFLIIGVVLRFIPRGR